MSEPPTQTPRGPARGGVVLYAQDRARLVHFYEAFGFQRLHETHELSVLAHPSLQLVLHDLPPTASPLDPAAAPAQRLKFFVAVDDLDAANARATERGGVELPPRYGGPLFTTCNLLDPEGNLFMLRAFHERPEP